MDQTTLQALSELPGLYAAQEALQARIRDIETMTAAARREARPAVSQARLDALAKARAVQAAKRQTAARRRQR